MPMERKRNFVFIWESLDEFDNPGNLLRVIQSFNRTSTANRFYVRPSPISPDVIQAMSSNSMICLVSKSIGF
jgi:hypothetical protein